MDQEKIGDFIKNIRKKHHLTQNEMAKKLNVTYQAVSKWENGKSIPDISILKDISEKFNVEIDEIIKGKEKNKINKKIILYVISLILLFVTILIIILIPKKDFEFKTITTTCEDFNITGSAAYNKDKTSIYISNINYCKKEDLTVYDNIECDLYEKDSKTKISSCSSKNKETITDFLKDTTINVNNYSLNCKKFTSETLYLEIKAISNNKIKTYKIPITLNDNCKK